MIIKEATRFSVIIPAYNEEDILNSTITRVYTALLQFGEPFELMIADDGSEDSTSTIAKQWSERHPEIILVTNKINMGRGAALTKSFYKAKGEFIMYIDADLAIELVILKKIFALLKEDAADIVIGSKHIDGAEVDYPPLRRLCSKSYSLLTKLLLNSTICDYQCGCKGFKKVVIENILPFMRNNAWTWDTEIVIKSQWAGYRIKEIPVKVVNIYGRESKVHLIRDIRRMGLALIKLWAEKYLTKNQLKRFNGDT